jgi:hypothetical protein
MTFIALESSLVSMGFPTCQCTLHRLKAQVPDRQVCHCNMRPQMGLHVTCFIMLDMHWRWNHAVRWQSFPHLMRLRQLGCNLSRKVCPMPTTHIESSLNCAQDRG